MKQAITFIALATISALQHLIDALTEWPDIDQPLTQAPEPPFTGGSMQ